MWITKCTIYSKKKNKNNLFNIILLYLEGERERVKGGRIVKKYYKKKQKKAHIIIHNYYQIKMNGYSKL